MVLLPGHTQSSRTLSAGMGWAAGRAVNGMYMFLAALRWIRESFSFWDRRHGADHIIMATHDEGSCWVPNELRSAILLTHWAPLDYPRKSRSAWVADRYSDRYVNPRPFEVYASREAAGWLAPDRMHAACAACVQHDPLHGDCEIMNAYAFCADGAPVTRRYTRLGNTCSTCSEHRASTPPRTSVCQATSSRPAYAESPLLGSPAQPRSTLLFLRGDVGKTRLASYSNGVRQTLYRTWLEQGWKDKHGILIGDSEDVPGSYSNLLARSRFCVVATGDGFSMRAEDAMLHGCIPVLIMDNILPVWEPHLSWAELGIRIAEADIPRLPAILQALDGDGSTLVRVTVVGSCALSLNMTGGRLKYM